jgi:hypothetical protein
MGSILLKNPLDLIHKFSNIHKVPIMLNFDFNSWLAQQSFYPIPKFLGARVRYGLDGAI